MKRALSILALLVMLAGCSFNGARNITWEVVPTLQELQQICWTKSPNVVGCFRDGGVVCRVYTLEGDKEEHDTLGHEVKHCFKGRFHK